MREMKPDNALINYIPSEMITLSSNGLCITVRLILVDLFKVHRDIHFFAFKLK